MVNAPFFYTEIERDFVIKVKVKSNFESNFDAACIMVVQGNYTWIKAAFEKTDFGTAAVVSVVTDKISDNANGCNIEGDSVWLQVARVGENFAIHHSLDGETFEMARVFYLKTDKVLKVGIETQSPTGQGGPREFSELSIERKTIGSLRGGV